ncbi:MAG: LysM peptidoglycan-binding domain-containing protein [Lactobacillales bacterium]|jgi:flagellum-specific peptidoglycan hydrolase FlgJ/LysM repeat protein|nr:LysM peptidoglycan-binding domain-containing protein [Lactobacillales bacterium]
MIDNNMKRRDLRIARKKSQLQLVARKSAKIAGSAFAVTSVAAPVFLPAIEVNAEELSGYATGASQSLNYVAELAACAQPIADANDLYASVMIAQAIVESGWGSSTLSQAPYYNLFGIKGSYNGQSVTMNTMEFENGNWITIPQPFRVYPSFAESFADNAYVLRNTSFGNGSFYAGAWKSNTNSYQDATFYLQGRYATDPSYASKLNQVIANYGLTAYDTGAMGGGNVETPSAPEQSTPTPSTPETPSNDTTYTVKSGDTISGISARFGISMNELRSWNNLKGDLILIGQVLVVKKGTSVPAPDPSAPPTETPAPSAPVAPSTPSSETKYTVKAGDSIWAISSRYGISMNDLRSWNNLRGDLILVGQVLVVKKGTSVPVPAPSAPAAPSNSTTYTVKSGDSVWLIAHNYGISMADLVNWNNIKNYLIFPDQVLVVKKGTSSASQPSGNTTSGAYTVKSGDTLWAISQKAGLKVDTLKRINNLVSDLIYVGQQLKLK